MKASKFLVLLGGVIGIVAFFLPFLEFVHQGGTVAPSAMQFVTGGISAKGAETVNRVVQDMRIIVLVSFAPAVMCALFGLIGMLKGSFARGLGAGALLFGLLTFGVWFVLNTAAADAGARAGIGMWLLMVAGAAGAIGGLIALIKPDRGAAQTHRYAATIKA